MFKLEPLGRPASEFEWARVSWWLESVAYSSDSKARRGKARQCNELNPSLSLSGAGASEERGQSQGIGALARRPGLCRQAGRPASQPLGPDWPLGLFAAPPPANGVARLAGRPAILRASTSGSDSK